MTAPLPQYPFQQYSAHQPYTPMQAITNRVQPSPFARLQPHDNSSPYGVVPTTELEDPRPPQHRQHARHSGYHERPRVTPPRNTEVIDLTTPPRQSRSANPSPMRDTQPALVRYGEQPVQYRREEPSGSALHARPPFMRNEALPASSHHHFRRPPDPEPYDPTRPMLHLPEREIYHDPRLVSYEPYRPAAGPLYMPTNGQYIDVQQYPSAYPQQYGAQQFFQSRPEPTPQPIHGAPAPVQQMPIDGRR